MIWLLLLAWSGQCLSQVCDSNQALDYTHAIYFGDGTYGWANTLTSVWISKVTITPKSVSAVTTVVNSGFGWPTTMAATHDNSVLSFDDDTGVIQNIDLSTNARSVFVGTAHAATKTDGVGTSATFFKIRDMDWEKDDSKLWVTSFQWNHIRQVVRATRTSSTVYTSPESGVTEGTLPNVGKLAGGRYWRSRDLKFWLIFDETYHIFRRLDVATNQVRNVLGPYNTLSRDNDCMNGATPTAARFTRVYKAQFPFDGENYAYILEQGTIRKISWTAEGVHSVAFWYGHCSWPNTHSYELRDFVWATRDMMYVAFINGIGRLNVNTKAMTQLVSLSVASENQRAWAFYVGPPSCFNCPTGEYALNEVCVACPPGSFCVGGVASTCAVCAPEHYETSACTASSNTQCSPCAAACPEGTYESTACTATSNRVCTVSCTLCPENQYETYPCTSTSNRVCTTCDTCPVENQIVPCTTTSNRQCSSFPVRKKCTTYQECDINECVLKNGDDFSVTSDWVREWGCAGVAIRTYFPSISWCNTRGNTCDGSTFNTNTMDSGFCIVKKDWTNWVWYYCAPKPLTSCPATKYLVNSQCYDCPADSFCVGGNTSYQACRTCPLGTYRTLQCTSQYDTKCSSCSTCPSGLYRSATYTATEDTVCTNCTLCLAGHYQSSPCTSTSNRACTSCSPGG